MSKDVVWVKLDIAPFCMEVALNKGHLEEWTMSLAKCLAQKDPTLNEFGSRLLGEIEAYRHARSLDAKKRWEPMAPNGTHKEPKIPNANTSNDVMYCNTVSVLSIKEDKSNTVPAREKRKEAITAITDAIWKAAPSFSRQRSSKPSLRKALEATEPPVSLEMLSGILEGICAWKVSAKWLSEGGKYQ